MDSGRPFVPRPIKTAGAAEQIADQIRLAILSGQLRPGVRLPSEKNMAEDYSVSRATIRETMKLLSAAQLVEATRGATGGTFVRLPEAGSVAAGIAETLSLWFNTGATSLAEVNAARVWIERGCVRLAANNRDDEDLEALRVAVEAMEADAVDIDELLALDIEFHVAISHAAGNSVLELTMNAIHLVRPFTNTMLVPHLGTAPLAQQHRAIYEAILDEDEGAAEQAFDAHMAYLAEAREEALSDRRPEDVRIDALLNEAHPAFERIKARIYQARHPKT